MVKPLKVLHLFDLYLPHTMNWAYRLIEATPDTEPWIAAPWMVQNKYFHSGFRFFTRPLQRHLQWMPVTEWESARFSSLLRRSERFVPLYKKWLQRQLRTHRPDLLHAHFAPIGCHYLDMAQSLDIPLITSFYGYDYERLPLRSPAWKARYQQLFAKGDAITSVGKHGASVLIGQGADPEKTAVVSLGVDKSRFAFVPRTKTAGQLSMLQVATITEKKGYMDTLRALKLALAHCPNVHLTIAGEEQENGLAVEMRQFIRDNALQAHVTWLDFLPYTDLAGFFARFDVFIHPSHYAANRDLEGGPIVILEAQATGLPVIATTHFDIPSEVLHGKTGLLAPEHDPAQLAAYIQRFYDMDNADYQAFSRAARLHMETGFDMRKTGETMRTLYVKTINRL